jgi:plasmid replication initiation protein
MKNNQKLVAEQRNDFYSLIKEKISLNEMKFITLYMGLINARDEATRKVTIPLNLFLQIMDLGERTPIKDLKLITNTLLGRVINVPQDKGGYLAFQLFSECHLFFDDIKNEWKISFNAHDHSLSMFFYLKKHYTNYNIFYALRLSSRNQLRMYGVLKQYLFNKNSNKFVISIDDLKRDLLLEQNKHSNWKDFKSNILEICQKALSEFTDITFTFKPCKRVGKGGKITMLEFEVFDNPNIKNPFPNTMPETANTPILPKNHTNLKEPTAAQIDEMDTASNNTFNPKSQLKPWYIRIRTLFPAEIMDENKAHKEVIKSFIQIYNTAYSKEQKGELNKGIGAYISGIISKKEEERTTGIKQQYEQTEPQQNELGDFLRIVGEHNNNISKIKA